MIAVVDAKVDSVVDAVAGCKEWGLEAQVETTARWTNIRSSGR